MKVLLIEDDPATAQCMELMLRSEGFNVYTTDLGEEGLDLGILYEYDIILLDLILPDMSGYEVLKALRLRKVSTPVMIVSGLAGIDDKVKGLNLGADDYLTKPFHKDELVARIKSVVRRSHNLPTNIVSIGALTLDICERCVYVKGKPLHLTPKEYDLLEMFMLNPNHLITKEAALHHLYGGRDEPELKIMDVFVCRLRAKLPSAASIKTVWGTGWRFSSESSREAA